jgi:hypothetical protein
VYGLIAIVVVGSTLWVAVDAYGRDWSANRFADKPWLWIVGCLLLWVVVFPVYLVQRGRVPRVTQVAQPSGPLPTEPPRSATVSVLPAARRSGERLPPVFWWGLGSAVAMLIGAFGPWVTVLGLSVSGTDADNDGWIVVALGLVGLLCVLGERRTPSLGLLGAVAGGIGLAVTLYDRSDVSSAIDDAGVFGAVASVGWGLNLALVASASLAIHGLVAATQRARSPVPAPAAAPMVSLDPMLVHGPIPAAADAVLPPPVIALTAGWYADPRDANTLRYWTGDAWDEQTAELRPLT